MELSVRYRDKKVVPIAVHHRASLCSVYCEGQRECARSYMIEFTGAMLFL